MYCRNGFIIVTCSLCFVKFDSQVNNDHSLLNIFQQHNTDLIGQSPCNLSMIVKQKFNFHLIYRKKKKISTWRNFTRDNMSKFLLYRSDPFRIWYPLIIIPCFKRNTLWFQLLNIIIWVNIWIDKDYDYTILMGCLLIRIGEQVRNIIKLDVVYDSVFGWILFIWCCDTQWNGLPMYLSQETSQKWKQVKNGIKSTTVLEWNFDFDLNGI